MMSTSIRCCRMTTSYAAGDDILYFLGEGRKAKRRQFTRREDKRRQEMARAGKSSQV